MVPRRLHLWTRLQRFQPWDRNPDRLRSKFSFSHRPSRKVPHSPVLLLADFCDGSRGFSWRSSVDSPGLTPKLMLGRASYKITYDSLHGAKARLFREDRPRIRRPARRRRVRVLSHRGRDPWLLRSNPARFLWHLHSPASGRDGTACRFSVQVQGPLARLLQFNQQEGYSGSYRCVVGRFITSRTHDLPHFIF